MLYFLQATSSHNAFTCRFTMNQLHADFITKDCKHHYQVGLLKVGQVLQIRASTTKRDNFYLKRGGNSSKVMQSRRQMREMGKGNRF